MRPLRPHVRAPMPLLSMARRPLGAKVGATTAPVRGKSIITSQAEVEDYNRGVRQEIKDLQKAVSINAVKKWGPNGYAASIGVAGEVPNEKAAEFRAERAIWGFDAGKGPGPYLTFLDDWNKFQGRNFEADGTILWIGSPGAWGADYSLAGQLYDAVAAYRVKNNEWKSRFMKETGLPDPTPVSPIPDISKIDEEVKKSSGDTGLIPAGLGNSLSGIVWTVGGLAILFVGLAYVLPAFLGAASKSRAAYHGA